MTFLVLSGTAPEWEKCATKCAMQFFVLFERASARVGFDAPESAMVCMSCLVPPEFIHIFAAFVA